jgi:hypothetical protein
MNLREYAFLKIGNRYRSWLKNQTGDDVFGALAADLGGTRYSGLGLVCDSCYGEVVDQYSWLGSSFGTWFTDPRRAIFGKAPVFFFARFVLEK